MMNNLKLEATLHFEGLTWGDLQQFVTLASNAVSADELVSFMYDEEFDAIRGLSVALPADQVLDPQCFETD